MDSRGVNCSLDGGHSINSLPPVSNTASFLSRTGRYFVLACKTFPVASVLRSSRHYLIFLDDWEGRLGRKAQSPFSRCTVPQFRLSAFSYERAPRAPMHECVPLEFAVQRTSEITRQPGGGTANNFLRGYESALIEERGTNIRVWRSG